MTNRKIFTTGLLFACSSVFITTQAQAKDISPFTAKYSFSVKDKISGSGKATRTLKKSGNRWTYKTNAYAFGGLAKAHQSTSFNLSNNKVKLAYASTTYKVLGKRNRHTVKFGGSSVVSTYKKKSHRLKKPVRNVYDDLALEVQIRQDLLNGKFTGNYYRVSKDSIVKTKFRKSGTVTLKTRAGTFKTIRIDRVHKNKNRQTTFWLAPSLDYLPIKIVTKDKNTRVKLVLNSLKK